MPTINIVVAGKRATNTSPGEVIVCGNSDYYIQFAFDSEWDKEPARTARFAYHRDGRALYQDVVFSGDTVAVPVLSGVSFVLVGVYAGLLHTTTPAQVLCDRSILCGSADPDGLNEKWLEELYKDALNKAQLSIVELEAIVRNMAEMAAQLPPVETLQELPGKVSKLETAAVEFSKALEGLQENANPLPAVSAEDNGKFLRVVDGAWAAAALQNVSEVGM